MEPRKFVVDIDLNKHELIRAVVHNSSTPPTTPKNGQIYYNTTDDTIYCYIINTWVNLIQSYTHPSFTALNPTLSGANVLASIQVNSEGHVSSINTRALTLQDLGYTGDPNANEYTHPTFTGNALGGPLTNAQVIDDVTVNNNGHVTGFSTRDLTPQDIGAAVINDAVTNLTQTWSSEKIQQEINNAIGGITGGFLYQGAYDAATNTPAIDASDGTPISGILTSHTYKVTVDGTFFTTPVTAGDELIANVDAPTTESDWTIVVRDIPSVEDASTTVKGIIEIATQTEVNLGLSSVLAVTPTTLHQYFSTNKYIEDVGNGTLTEFTLTHNLNTKNVLVECYEKASGDTITASVKRIDVNSIKVFFNDAPESNEVTVVIKK